MHAQATIANVRSLVLALQAIKTPHKLPCAVTFEAGSGLSLRFLNSAHTMQSGFSLSPAAFTHFHAPSSVTFFLPLGVLLDAINTVASSMPHELHFQFPGNDNSLLLTTTEDSSARTSIHSFAEIPTLAQHDLHSLDDMWEPQEESSQVILSGPLLREAIEDLEWTGGPVSIVLNRCPTRFSLHSVKQQSLEVTFPASLMDGFSCQADVVQASFQHKHLKAAFANISHRDPWSVKIAISSRGILKVTHMLTLSGGGPLPNEVPLLGSLASQAQAVQRICIIKFMILPLGDDEDEARLRGHED